LVFVEAYYHYTNGQRCGSGSVAWSEPDPELCFSDWTLAIK